MSHRSAESRHQFKDFALICKPCSVIISECSEDKTLISFKAQFEFAESSVSSEYKNEQMFSVSLLVKPKGNCTSQIIC